MKDDIRMLLKLKAHLRLDGRLSPASLMVFVHWLHFSLIFNVYCFWQAFFPFFFFYYFRSRTIVVVDSLSLWLSLFRSCIVIFSSVLRRYLCDVFFCRVV